MELNELRIVCFGSGDFPIETFKFLANYYNVVGFVTSNDKPVFGTERVYDIAKQRNIPVYIPNNLEDKEFLNWLDDISGNVYCVISYKYLPKCVTEKVKYAFNIHASLLPLLRGAAPISWAIRYGFNRTGLSAIKLADKIDTGGIICQYGIDINPNDNYETLFKRLASQTPIMAEGIIESILNDKFYANVEQPIIPKKLDSKIFHAPKLTLENTTFHMYGDDMYTSKELYDMIRSLSPHFGTTFNLTIRKWVKDENEEYEGHFDDVKEITFKVYDADLVHKDNKWIEEHYNGSDIITDWKKYLYILPSYASGDEVVSVNIIQIKGKKILGIRDFLKGFQVYNKPEYNFFLN